MPPSPVCLDFVLAIMPILRARLFLEERNMVREPMLTTVPIADLRPTQLTVGMREVEAKRKRWREIAAKEGGKFLGKHMIPTVLGPKAPTMWSITIILRARSMTRASKTWR
jgi:hypothetical protein